MNITRYIIYTLAVLLTLPTLAREVVVTAKISAFHAVWDGCSVNIIDINGTHPTINPPECGSRMKVTNSDNIEATRSICSALLSAQAQNATVSMGFPSDGNACDCGCPIHWATIHTN